MLHVLTLYCFSSMSSKNEMLMQLQSLKRLRKRHDRCYHAELTTWPDM